ncbi:MAG: Dam family site-specific DNA-(adenine-N6)-methyltransferase [Alphaproteobacteria bacterium]|nr:Dam family site-specific DNA-(adenine-N6)-methyltransferase [Alphaproteobacteria bacterium]
MSANRISPFLRWAGSKRSVLPFLSRHVPARYERYIEPFAGSACLFFFVAPSRGVISDLNSELIETYLTVRQHPSETARILAEMPVSRGDYYVVRAMRSSDLNERERAARFIYLNRFCFNGLYRTNTLGKFNVPFGAPKNNSVPSERHLNACADLLWSSDIVCGDFETVVSNVVKDGDFVYLDPPFFQTSKRVFREYTAKPFMESDLVRLRELLQTIDGKGATFVVSYSYCPEVEEIFRGWKTTTIETQRNISGFAKHRRKAMELIVTNS